MREVRGRLRSAVEGLGLDWAVHARDVDGAGSSAETRWVSEGVRRGRQWADCMTRVSARAGVGGRRHRQVDRLAAKAASRPARRAQRTARRDGRARTMQGADSSGAERSGETGWGINWRIGEITAYRANDRGVPWQIAVHIDSKVDYYKLSDGL